MAEFQCIFCCPSIDDKGGGWGGRWQKPPLGTPHEQP